MIKSIHVKNFISHLDTRLDLAPGVNALVGASDQGKTALFNALDWVFNNRPTGNEFESWWGGEPWVRVEFTDGHVVTRCRKKTGENFYYLKKPGSMRQTPFTAFRARVPEAIQQVINISAVNFRFQLDDPFMLSQSAPAVARELNRVVDLEVIDTAQKNINSRWREEDGKLQTANTDHERLIDDLKAFDWLPEAEGCLTKLEAQEQRITGLRGQRKALNKLVIDMDVIITDLDRLNTGPILAADQVNNQLSNSSTIDKAIEKSDSLASFMSEIEATEQKINKVATLLPAAETTEKLLLLDREIDNLAEEHGDLTVQIDLIQETESRLAKITSQRDKMKNEFNRLMPDQCPLCGK